MVDVALRIFCIVLLVVVIVSVVQMWDGINHAGRVADAIAGRYGVSPAACDACSMVPNLKTMQNCSIVLSGCAVKYPPILKHGKFVAFDYKNSGI